MKIQKKSDRHYRQLKSTKTGEEYSRSNVISEALFSTDIFLSHEIISPNSRSSSPHFHTHTDELIYVLSGKLVAVEGDSEIVVEEGDSVMFERQSGKHHFLKNESNSDGHILLIRKKLGSPDVIFPESN
ncbi:cupin domain-containing protein [Peredibacter starrii]|uniref:Cupin domain-containing protein n=1 Tax=Peredibacter starrii TaxID=28202 RepID=A0AAX4HNR4_9BACT|nr:cupin domain-containing protein [Peredibacter starrii]WPU64960.1 cupin domain-containing protein [Peredibacter starrii]